eukprot:1280021-Rhodomonas_salina.1
MCIRDRDDSHEESDHDQYHPHLPYTPPISTTKTVQTPDQYKQNSTAVKLPISTNKRVPQPVGVSLPVGSRPVQRPRP